MKTIVIESSKESGKEVALRVSKQTGIPVFDTQTVIDTAEQLGADAACLKQYDEENFGSLVYTLFISSNRYENRTVQRSFSALAEAIRLLYHKHNGGIFMGKFAAEILSELDTVFIAHIEPSNGDHYNIVLQKSVKSLDQCANSIIHLAEL